MDFIIYATFHFCEVQFFFTIAFVVFTLIMVIPFLFSIRSDSRLREWCLGTRVFLDETFVRNLFIVSFTRIQHAALFPSTYRYRSLARFL